MSNTTFTLEPTLYQYLIQNSLQEHPLLKVLRDVTSKMPASQMQIAPEQGQLMALLVKLTGAKTILEIGTFTGYSSLAMALALPDEGKLIALDRDPRSTAIAKEYWEKAGVAHKVELKIGTALETLDTLTGPFDLVFIDADKSNYENYYEKTLELLRPGGLILFDNVFQGGRVVSPASDDNSANAIDAFNKKLHQDSRVDIAMVPIADGLTFARKR